MHNYKLFEVFPTEVVYLIADQLPPFRLGELIPLLGDYAINRKYAHVKVNAFERHIGEASFGNADNKITLDAFVSPDPSQSTQTSHTIENINPPEEFRSIYAYLHFLETYLDVYIPKSIEFADPIDLLTVHSKHPAVLQRAGGISVKLINMDEFDEGFIDLCNSILSLPYNITSVYYAPAEVSLHLPLGLQKFESVGGSIPGMMLYSPFESLKVMRLGYVSTAEPMDLELLPKSLETLLLVCCYVFDRPLFTLNLPNLKKLQITNDLYAERSFDFSNLTKLEKFTLDGPSVTTLANVRMPESLKHLRLIGLHGLRDLVGVKKLINLESLVVRCNSNLQHFEFPDALKIIEIDYLFTDIRAQWQDTIDSGLLQMSLVLPKDLRELCIFSQNDNRYSIESFEMPTKLKMLHLLGWTIRDWPAWKLPNTLKVISFKCNGLSLLKKTEWPSYLTYLDLRHNLILHFDGLHKLEFLHTLHLEDNLLKGVGELPCSLVYVGLGGNDLSSFQGSKLTNLEYLDLSSNRFRGSINDSILSLPNGLITLKLGDNRITSFAEAYKLPIGLRSLFLYDNLLDSSPLSLFRSVPQSMAYLEVGYAADIERTSSTVDLRMADVDISDTDGKVSTTGKEEESDPPVKNLERAKSIYKATSTGKGTTIELDFPNLKGLYFYGYKTFNESISLANCRQLEVVEFSGMKLSTMDWDLFPDSLKIVGLNECDLHDLKGDLTRLKKLQRLNLGGNKLGNYLQKNILRLPDSLVLLMLVRNGLTEFAGVSGGANLRVIDLQNNPEISKSASLKQLCNKFRIGERLDYMKILYDK